jgi:hypothetical protein
MNRTANIISTVLMASLALLTTLAFTEAVRAAEAPPDKPKQVERGKYLVTIAGCHDCHTPLKMGANGPEPDMDRALSGHPESIRITAPPPAEAGPWENRFSGTSTAWAGPWGVSFTANLTPDRETGLGSWTLRNFRDTIRNGRHLGRGRPLLPPMPWPMYRNMTDEDLAAVFTYLQSIPAVVNRVPEPLPPEAEKASK